MIKAIHLTCANAGRARNIKDIWASLTATYFFAGAKCKRRKINIVVFNSDNSERRIDIFDFEGWVSIEMHGVDTRFLNDNELTTAQKAALIEGIYQLSLIKGIGIDEVEISKRLTSLEHYLTEKKYFEHIIKEKKVKDFSAEITLVMTCDKMSLYMRVHSSGFIEIDDKIYEGEPSWDLEWSQNIDLKFVRNSVFLNIEKLPGQVNVKREYEIKNSNPYGGTIK
jgi:hypothetical protein